MSEGHAHRRGPPDCVPPAQGVAFTDALDKRAEYPTLPGHETVESVQACIDSVWGEVRRPPPLLVRRAPCFVAARPRNRTPKSIRFAPPPLPSSLTHATQTHASVVSLLWANVPDPEASLPAAPASPPAQQPVQPEDSLAAPVSSSSLGDVLGGDKSSADLTADAADAPGAALALSPGCGCGVESDTGVSKGN